MEKQQETFTAGAQAKRVKGDLFLGVLNSSTDFDDSLYFLKLFWCRLVRFWAIEVWIVCDIFSKKKEF